MPFSFKPEITQQVGSPLGQTPTQANPDSLATNFAGREKSEGKSFIEIALFALFGFTALLAVGVFAYHFYLSSQVEAKKAALAEYESNLAGLPLEDMRKASNRLKLISQLVKEHPSVNVAFLILEASVENTVIFKRFTLSYSDSAKSYQLGLTGVAPDYKSVAQQLDTYKAKPYSLYIPKVTIDTLSPDETGKIVFSLTMPVSIMGLLPETFTMTEGVSETDSAVLEEGLPLPASDATGGTIETASTTANTATTTPPSNP